MLKRVCEGLRLGLFHGRFFSGLLALLAFQHSVSHLAGDQLDRADGVVVAGMT